MIEILKSMAALINNCHDTIISFLKVQGYNFTDKELHFIVIALVGIVIFACVHLLFKFLSKYSITAISFVYTFTVLIVIVFAIEIQQKLTGSGVMDFADILYGLYGFLFVFAVFLLIKGICVAIKKIIQHCKEKQGKKKK